MVRPGQAFRLKAIDLGLERHSQVRLHPDGIDPTNGGHWYLSHPHVGLVAPVGITALFDGHEAPGSLDDHDRWIAIRSRWSGRRFGSGSSQTTKLDHESLTGLNFQKSGATPIRPAYRERGRRLGPILEYRWGNPAIGITVATLGHTIGSTALVPDHATRTLEVEDHDKRKAPEICGRFRPEST